MSGACADDVVEAYEHLRRLIAGGVVVIQGDGNVFKRRKGDIGLILAKLRVARAVVTGLAIAKNIVEGMGGTIALDSRAGSGTEIRIDLPSREDLPAGTGSAEVGIHGT